MNYPILYMVMVNLFNFTVYISLPIVVRFVVLKKPLKSIWLAIWILLPIFIGFSIITYRIASSEIMLSYLSALNDNAIEFYGSPMTAKEEAHYRNKFDEAATKYGLWEAIPAAVIQRQEIKRKIYQDHNITASTRPRILGSPMLLCVSMVLSFYILRKGHKTVSAAKNNELKIHGVAASKLTEASNFQPICPNCRTETPIDSVYCRKCGNKIAEPFEAKQS